MFQIKKFYNSNIANSLIRKLVLSTMGLVIISLIIILLVNYYIVKSNIENIVMKDLNANVNALYDLIDNAYDDFRINLYSTAENNLSSCEAIYKKNPGAARDIMKNFILSQKIGKSGYLYCVDSKGIIRVHPNSRLIGADLSKHQFIMDTLEKKNGIIEYRWANPGETVEREKVVAFTYFKPFDWHISVSAYLEEFSEKFQNDNMKKNGLALKTLKERIKKLKIGEEGYAYIMNYDGKLVVHPKNEGENISNFDFIKKILKEKNGTHIYPWEGKSKIVGYKEFKPLKWIIIAGSYYSDFLNKPMEKIVLASLILLFSLAAVIFYMIIRIIRRIIIEPVNHTREIAESIKNGDFTTIVDVSGEDEIGMMMKSIADMIKSQRNIIKTILASVGNLNKASLELESISSDMSSMSQSQAASLEETAASLEELLASMTLISEKTETQFASVDMNHNHMGQMAEEAADTYHEAVSVTELMKRTSDEAKEGETKLNLMVDEMGEIKESTSQIAEIIKIISDISEKVNLLSLNAAIVAARAGEHGRGFAVVADEISKLAEQTATSANTISQLVNEGNSQVDSGTETVNRTAESFRNIISSIESVSITMIKFSETLQMLSGKAGKAKDNTTKVRALSSDIASATHEQMKTNREISKTIEDVNESSQRVVHYAESISTASEEIGKIASGLKEQMSNLKID